MPNNNFCCPECSSTKLIETMIDVVVSSECSVDDEGDVFYGDQTNEDGSVIGYQCENGHELIWEGDRITDGETLLEWIQGNPAKGGKS